MSNYLIFSRCSCSGEIPLLPYFNYRHLANGSANSFFLIIKTCIILQGYQKCCFPTSVREKKRGENYPRDKKTRSEMLLFTRSPRESLVQYRSVQHKKTGIVRKLTCPPSHQYQLLPACRIGVCLINNKAYLQTYRLPTSKQNLVSQKKKGR